MSVNNDESLLPKNRIEALCDGIFAIAMTLIILDLKTPENIPLNKLKEELPKILFELIPEMEAYAVSFIVLAIFWLRHQIHFKFLKSADKKILTINVVFLLFIGFVPFSVGFMMRYYNFHLPYLVYVINLLIISVILYYHWFYISGNDSLLLENETDIVIVKKYRFLSFIPVIIFSLSLFVSFFSVRIAFFIIYLDPIFYMLYRFVDKKITNVIRQRYCSEQ